MIQQLNQNAHLVSITHYVHTSHFMNIAAEMSQKCRRKNGRDIDGDNNDFLAQFRSGENGRDIHAAAKTASFTASSVRCESKGFNHQSIGKIKNIRIMKRKGF